MSRSSLAGRGGTGGSAGAGGRAAGVAETPAAPTRGTPAAAARDAASDYTEDLNCPPITIRRPNASAIRLRATSGCARGEACYPVRRLSDWSRVIARNTARVARRRARGSKATPASSVAARRASSASSPDRATSASSFARSALRVAVPPAWSASPSTSKVSADAFEPGRDRSKPLLGATGLRRSPGSRVGAAAGRPGVCRRGLRGQVGAAASARTAMPRSSSRASSIPIARTTIAALRSTASKIAALRCLPWSATIATNAPRTAANRRPEAANRVRSPATRTATGTTGPRPGFRRGGPGACGDDCDDTSAKAFPGGRELCDGTDNDCNGIVDDDSGYDPAGERPMLVSSGGFNQAQPRRHQPQRVALRRHVHRRTRQLG